MDLSLENIWRTWSSFSKGKRRSQNLFAFKINLEEELLLLQKELSENRYTHGKYRKFIVNENKKREISVAEIKDRIVHRLVYDYLVEKYDHSFDFDVWSCRSGKGLQGAINRLQSFAGKHRNGYFWRADINKYFDSVGLKILFNLLNKKITTKNDLNILAKIIFNEKEQLTGIPIGNLTSQIFANIYLNEFDRFIRHQIKPNAYLRYGDDFILFAYDKNKLIQFAHQSEIFLKQELNLNLHPTNNIIKSVKSGIKMLGVVIFPDGRKLKPRNIKHIKSRLSNTNASSYHGLIKQNHSKLYPQFIHALGNLQNQS